MTGFFLDCTGCAPGNRYEDMSSVQKKAAWSECMVDCVPTPSCKEMCENGNKECFDKCVVDYSAVVEPYWDLFKGSLEAHPLEAGEPVSKGSLKKNQAAPKDTVQLHEQ